MAICLPGMASRVKRAATSETRLEPLVMTVKFTMRRMRKMTRPTTRLPPTAKRPKVSIMWPAAPGPSPPWSRMRRVVATLRASRKSVMMRSSEGKTEKSTALVSPRATRSMTTEMATERASRSVEAGGRHRHDQDGDDAEHRHGDEGLGPSLRLRSR